MKYVTRLGEFELSENEIIHFPVGIPGFEHLRKFAVISLGDEYPICWLVSLEDEAVALPIIDPWLVVENYEVELSNDDVSQLGVSDPSELVVWVVLTIRPGDPATVTANLRAPIVVNSRNATGVQVIMDKYDIRYPLTGSKSTTISSEPGTIGNR